MKQAGFNQEAIQSLNRTLILQHLQQEKTCSRVHLAQLTGLKQATITNIINDFISWGIVEETGLIGGPRGRRAIEIRLEQERFAVVGVRLARQYFDVGLFSLPGTLVGEKNRFPITDSSPQKVLRAIPAAIRNLLASATERRVLAIGVAVPGPYYVREGRIEDVFPGWDAISVHEELQKEFLLPVIVEHDANAGVLAEHVFGPNKEGCDTIVYLAVGQGIGAGIYHDGRIYRGASGIAGEIGHISINLDGPLCSCGNRGCLTAYASTIALTDRINRARRQVNPTASMYTWKDLVQEETRRDPIVQEELRRNVRYLAAAINNLIYTYSPNRIIIGDEILELGKKIADEIAGSLVYLKRHQDQENVQICSSSLDMDPAFLGAAEFAIDYVFHNHALFQADPNAAEA